MKVVIAGGGSVGRFIAEQLHEGGHEVLIMDNDQAVVKQGVNSGEPKGVRWALADACEVSALTAAGLADADVVAAVTGDDEDNLVTSLLAKQEFGVPRVVARVNNPKNEWMFNEMWGVDVAVSTPHLITALVQEAVSVGSFVRLLSFEGGKARLAEVTLAVGSPAEGLLHVADGHSQPAFSGAKPRCLLVGLERLLLAHEPRPHRGERGPAEGVLRLNLD